MPPSVMILTSAFFVGMSLALYGYSQDRTLPLYLGLGMSLFGGVFGALRIALWGDDR